VPLLGNLPLIGGLFRQQSEQRKKRELVIFITPSASVCPSLTVT
jgi:protein transport protein HofQ